MWWKRFALFCGVVIATLAISVGQPESKEKNPEKTADEIYTIFSADDLFGKGFLANVQYLPCWAKIGQSSVAIFRDKVVGNKPYKSTEEAGAAGVALRQTLRFSPDFAPKFAELFARMKTEKADVKVEVIEFFGDDDSVRLAWKTREGSTFPKGLTIETVRKRLGRLEEKVTKQVLRSEQAEGRPVVLTLHVYAEGSVIFAESDLAAKPGTVDRVILDVPMLSKVMFKEK